MADWTDCNLFGDSTAGVEEKETQADFQLANFSLAGLSTIRRPGAVSSDYFRPRSMGPSALDSPAGGLLFRPWLATFVPGIDEIQLFSLSVDGTVVEALAETFVITDGLAPVLELDLAFSSTAKAYYTMERATGVSGAKEVWLRWFDPRIGPSGAEVSSTAFRMSPVAMLTARVALS